MSKKIELVLQVLLVVLVCLGVMSWLGWIKIPVMDTLWTRLGAKQESESAVVQVETPPQTEEVTESATSHVHNFQQAKVVEATCTREGYTLMECYCGESVEAETTQALGHRYKSKTSGNKTVYTCSRCGDSYTKTKEEDKTDSNQQPAQVELHLNKTDVTLYVGDCFVLDLLDPDGKYVSGVVWSSDDTNIAKVSLGKVDAVSAGKTQINATYGGKKYTCTVRVKAKETDESKEAEKESGDISVPIG